VIGRTISHYKILEKIGEGGMGIVFKAEDTKLKRPVVLKFLPPHLTANADAVARFEREAQAAAALNHPNIVTIYDIGEFEGQIYICMEFLDGENLATIVERGPLPPEHAIDIASKVGEGLDKAHRAGIVHRDVKPENIVVSGDGSVKILDFGLAKLRGVSKLTKESSTLGTVSYMSPELTKGAEVDQRTDIWSLGIVLYEMISGRKPFAGDYEQAVAYSIINEPHEPLGSVVPEARELDAVIDRALAKTADERYPSIDAMVRELESLGAFDPNRRSAGKASAKRRGTPIFVGVFAVVVVVVAIVVALRVTGPRKDVTEPTRETSAVTPARTIELKQVTVSSALEEYPDFSPDGREIAFCTEWNGFKQIVVRDLQTGDERRVTNVEADNIQPVWSRDGTAIVFVRANQPNGKIEPSDVYGAFRSGDIWRLDLETGKEQKILESAYNPSFSPGGDRIALDASWAGTRRIWISDGFGRNPEQATVDESEAVSHLDPQWSPDGQKIVFVNKEWTKFDIKVVDLTSRESVWLTNDLYQDLNPVWSPDGQSIYCSSYRGGGLNVWQIPMRPDGTALAPPRQLTTGAGQDIQLAISTDGKRLAMSILGINADLWGLPVSPSTGLPTGEPRQFVATTREDSRGAWSPDGERIAFNSDRTGDMNLWIYSLDDETEHRVTTGAGGDYQANWSPDGSILVFFSSRAGNADIWAVDLNTKELRRLTSSLSLDINPFFSPDGEWIAFQSDRDGRRELWVMDKNGNEQRRLTNIGAAGHFMRWTPDGERVVFASPSGESGQLFQVAVAGGDPDAFAVIKGTSHISFSPAFDAIIDVSGHKKIWYSPLGEGEFVEVFEFDDPDVRIDYPVWSPDGRWLVFDRLEHSGGDIWFLENLN
jgi:Tol biopolymer transport system component/predicted Ser/Thr protein kinase